MDNLNILLKYDLGFKWYKEDKFYFKGYIFDKNNNFLECSEAVAYLKGIEKNFGIKSAVKDLNGVFAFIKISDSSIIIVCDRMRTFPLFYSITGNQIIVSDKCDECSDIPVIDQKSADEFEYTGYVTADRTLINNVNQVQAGEVIEIDENGAVGKFYHTYIIEEQRKGDNEGLVDQLNRIFEKIKSRLSASLKGKIPVIPLSGGYDSRLLAVMLKNLGFDNVICYTYGRKSNPEVRVSQKVAEQLGYKWLFIEYTDDVIQNYIDSFEFKKYYEFSANNVSMFFMQEYFAVKNLKNLIPENSVFIPGHSGDFFGGSHLNDKIVNSRTKKELVKEIIEHHYNLKKTDKSFRKIVSEELMQQISDLSGPCYSIYENWDLKERQSKFIVNSSRIYEHFGYQHRLPLMDSELMNYFVDIDTYYKKRKQLYDIVLKENYFESYSLNFKDELQVTDKDFVIKKLKENLKNILPARIVNVYKYHYNTSGDRFYYINITDKMKEEMERNNYKIKETGRDKNSVIVQWYLYKLNRKYRRKR